MPTVIENICINNSRYKANQRIAPVGVVLHSIGVPQPDASVLHRSWANNQSQYLTHYVLDDVKIIHGMPDNRKCWHVGSPGNDKWIGIEMCEPKQIKYKTGATFTVLDKAAAQSYAKACYENAVWLIARLCKEYGWNPQTAILTHNEVTAKKLSKTDHVDPEHLWKGLGLSYSLKTLRNDVAAAMGKKPVEPSPAAPTTEAKETRYTMTMRTLKRGSKGEDVRALQILLIGRGYSCGNYGADGDFGGATEAAVRSYQNPRGLTIDGIAGPATMGSLLGV